MGPIKIDQWLDLPFYGKEHCIAFNSGYKFSQDNHLSIILKRQKRNHWLNKFNLLVIELQLNHNSHIFELFPKEVNQTRRRYRQNDTMTIKKSPDNVSQQNIKPL